MLNNMPNEARQAFERAHRERGKRSTAPPTNNRSAAHSEWLAVLADERKARQKHSKEIADRLAWDAEIYLENRTTPRLTTLRPAIRDLKDKARQQRIARARSPERQRATQQRHINMVCHSILKERGLQ